MARVTRRSAKNPPPPEPEPEPIQQEAPPPNDPEPETESIEPTPIVIDLAPEEETQFEQPDPSPLPRRTPSPRTLSKSPLLRSRSSSPISRRSDSRDRRFYTASVSPARSQSPVYEPIRSELPTSLDYKLVLTLEGHEQTVSGVKFSPDGKRIASCCTFIAKLSRKSRLTRI
jgi:hypothetical protein